MNRVFQINTAPGGMSEVRVDGFLLGGVRGYRLTDHVTDGIPRLEVELVLLEATDASGQARVVVPTATHEALVALGWTPPKES